MGLCAGTFNMDHRDTAEEGGQGTRRVAVNGEHVQ